MLASEAFALRKAGYHVLTAVTQRQAVECFVDAIPEIAVVDIGLPDGDGWQLGRWLKAQHVPFIFVTGRKLVWDDACQRGLGMADYLVKPIQLDELVSRVDKALLQVRSSDYG